MLAILQFFTNTAAQDAEAVFTVETGDKAVVYVKGRFLGTETRQRRQNLYFLHTFLGINISGKRISDLHLKDASGSDVSFKEMIDGEYLAESDFDTWNYSVDISVPEESRATAHFSWIGKDRGVLMLADLLPRFGGLKTSARIKVDPPTGWSIVTTEKLTDRSTYEVTNTEDGIFIIGRDLRTYGAADGLKGQLFQIVLSDEWLFNDAEAGKMAEDIVSYYKRAFWGIDPGNFQINLLKFPRDERQGIWEAETRGRNLTIISADMPFRSQSIQRLNEQLRHELFHLWIPNSLNLSRNYDWFYEGFALYYSLKTGIMLNQIGFSDFLDTLSRARNIDEASARRISLIEASKNRWSGAETQVYVRGMVTAFLIDLAMLRKSGGKLSVESVFRRLIELHRPPANTVDGSNAVLDVLKAHYELLPIIDKYILGTEKFDWHDYLISAGIEDSQRDSRAELRVMEKPNGRQKAILDKLGYNNWRKLSRQ